MHRRAFLQTSGAIALTSIATRQAAADEFVIRDRVVSDLSATVVDPEFTDVGYFMSWVDEEQKIWVNEVNPKTGRWRPTNGKQILIDSRLVPVSEIRQGSEWAFSDTGPRLVYSKRTNSIPRLFQAQFADGKWTKRRLPASKYQVAKQASKDENDPRPRMIYQRTDAPDSSVYGWRELDDPSTDELLTNYFPLGNKNPIWIVGQRAIASVDRFTKQVATFDVDTKEIKFVTQDDGLHDYEYRWPRMFHTPDGNVAAVTVNDSFIGIYYEIDGEYQMMNALRPPEAAYPYVFSPKLWFFEGEAYLSFLMAEEKDGVVQKHQGAAEVWITKVTDTEPWYRRVSDPLVTRIKDTEGVSYPNGIYVYYAEILPDQRRLIHRCDTGLL